MSNSKWREAKDSKGRVYYYDSGTGKSQWEKPEELFSEQELLLHKHGWKVNKTPEGKTYYYNAHAGTSQWDVPEFREQDVHEAGRVIKKDQESKERNQDIPQGVKDFNSLKNDDEIDEEEAYMKFQNNSKILNPPKKLKEDAEKEFMEMLQENQVDSTWSFSRIISDIGAKDPRYWMVDDDPLWKQEIFEKYLTNRTEDQLLKERTETAKFTEAFEKMLSNMPQIKYYTRWPTARRLITNEPIYKHSVVKEAVKRKTFLNFVDRLKKKHDESIGHLKSQAVNELREYLLNIISNHDSYSKNNDDLPIISWHNLLNNYLFEKNKRFMANKHFKILTYEDVLGLYLELLEIEEKKLENEWTVLDDNCYTKDRIARDNFKSLLRQPTLGIRANSNWADIYPKLKNDVSFLCMLGTNGSTALDLFYDYVEELGITIAAHRSMAQTLLIEKNFCWEDDITKNRDLIMELLKNSPDFENVDEKDKDVIINQLVEIRKDTLRQQAEVKVRLQEQRKHMFKAMLHRTFRAIQNKPKWDVACEQIRGTSEFKELESDQDLLQSLYEEFLNEHSITVSSGSTVPSHNSKKRPLTSTIELDY